MDNVETVKTVAVEEPPKAEAPQGAKPVKKTQEMTPERLEKLRLAREKATAKLKEYAEIRRKERELQELEKLETVKRLDKQLEEKRGALGTQAAPADAPKRTKTKKYVVSRRAGDSSDSTSDSSLEEVDARAYYRQKFKNKYRNKYSSKKAPVEPPPQQPPLQVAARDAIRSRVHDEALRIAFANMFPGVTYK